MKLICDYANRELCTLCLHSKPHELIYDSWGSCDRPVKCAKPDRYGMVSVTCCVEKEE